MKKKILIVLGSLVVVVMVALFLVAANLNKIINSRKGDLLAKAKQQTGRDISIGDVGVTLWPGLGASVRDLTISDDPEYASDPFVSAKELVVSVKFWPLLKKRVEVKRLILNQPQIAIIKADAKHFNFTSLVEATAAQDSTRKEQASNSNVAAVLAFADIKDGTLRYVDRVTGVDRTVRKIDFTASNVGIGEKTDATLRAAVFGDEQDIMVEASAGPLGDPANKEALGATPLDVMIQLQPVAINALMAAGAKPGQPAPPPVEGDLKAELKITGTLGEARLEDVNVSASLLGAKEPNMTLQASGGPFNFTADSTEVFSHATLSGRLETQPIALSNFKVPSKDPGVPAPVLGGDLRADATFEGNLTALAFQGNIDATNATFEQKDGLTKPAGIPAKASVKGTFHPEKTPGEGIDLEKIDITFHSLTGTGSGRVVPFKGREVLEISLDAKTALKPWNDLMPAMAPFNVSGDATANVKLSGMPTPEKPSQISGTAILKNLGASTPQLPKPITDGEARVAFTDKTANIKGATFRIGESRFTMDLAITAFKPMTADFTVTSDAVNRPDVQAPVPNAPPLKMPEVFRKVVATGHMTETAPKIVENDIQITSASGTFADIDYSDFKGDVHVTPATTTLNSFSAKAMGGTITGRGTLQPVESKFDVTTKIANLNLAEYFKYKAPALTDVLSGKISGDMQIAGQGKEWESIAKTLTGGGTALVIEGSLLNVNIANEIFSSINKVPMVPSDLTQKMRAKNPQLFSQDKTVFQNLSSKFTINNGRIQVPDLKLATSDFALNGDGWFSFTKEMSVNSTLSLSKKLSSDLVAEFPMAKYLLTPEGRIDVPLSLSGGLMKPTIKVDTAAMTTKFQKSLVSDGQQQLQEKAKTGLKDLLGGKKTAPPDTTKK